ncbi:hypothetical protein H7I77_09755 [Mycolicibacterium novocastrense]|uniref:Uncharacterized protein n=1 Tax=Mycolicibacterium novocastrense TaxID=59813 RepID=A0AAW5SJ91_MYCNV|nr:hypothetical protein [Mycolicibacterium novocastrense]MCV7023630.1 hypothetical protein [Mycolicibacterium novocastrense]GAT07726.1 uncharacterized protein RMCN_0859 [Mycolicibacterium novocastrense]
MAAQTQYLVADTIPSLRDWVHSAGFGGTAAVLAALIVLLGLLATSRRSDKRRQSEMDQRDRHHQETHEAQQRAAAINRCWDRLTWIVQTADMELAATDPASANMGLGPELAEELLRGLKRDAEELGDETLANATAVYLTQLGLVLTQQIDRFAEVAAAQAPPADDRPAAARSPSSSGDENNSTPTTPAADDKPAKATDGEGRRRR